MLKNLIFSLLKQYGDPILFLWLLLEYLGLPFVPGEAMMSFIGYLKVTESAFKTFSSIIFATAGTFTGSMIAWLLAYKYGEGIVLKLGRPIHITKKKLDMAKISFDKHQVSLIIFSRFVPGLRHIIPYLSGINKVEAKRYALLNLSGSAFWCITFIYLGQQLGEKWHTIINLSKTYSLALILLIVFIFITLKYFNKHQSLIFSIAFPLLLFIKLSEDVIQQELSVFDNSIYNFIASFITEDMTDFMKFLTFLGSGPVLIGITVLFIVSLRKSKKYSFYSWMIGINLLSSTLLDELFKIIFHRQRPDILRLIDITGYSFPSGHSMTGLCFYGFIIYILWINMKSKWKYLLFSLSVFLILSIGISRIYLGVHYASDVLGGFSAGLAWLAVFIPICKKLNNKYAKEET